MKGSFLITIKISKNYPKFLIFYPNKNYVIIASRGVTMDNKFNNIMNEFFANTDAKDDKELNKFDKFEIKLIILLLIDI